MKARDGEARGEHVAHEARGVDVAKACVVVDLIAPGGGEEHDPLLLRAGLGGQAAEVEHLTGRHRADGRRVRGAAHAGPERLREVDVDLAQLAGRDRDGATLAATVVNERDAMLAGKDVDRVARGSAEGGARRG